MFFKRPVYTKPVSPHMNIIWNDFSYETHVTVIWWSYENAIMSFSYTKFYKNIT